MEGRSGRASCRCSFVAVGVFVGGVVEGRFRVGEVAHRRMNVNVYLHLLEFLRIFLGFSGSSFRSQVARSERVWKIVVWIQ